MNRVSNDVDNVDNVVTGTLTSIVTNVVLIGTTLVAMFLWNWRLALISIVIVPLMVFPLGPVGRRMYQIRKKTREKRDEIESITQETLSISRDHADQVVRARGVRAVALLSDRYAADAARDRPRDGRPLVSRLGYRDGRRRAGAGLVRRRLARDLGRPAESA